MAAGISPPELSPATDVGAVVDGVVSEVIEEASGALETTAAVPDAADASVEDDDPEQAASPAEPPDTATPAESESAQNDVDGASTKASTPDTTADSADTTPDSSVSTESDAEERPAAPGAAPTKAGPTPAAINLNVSVRIGSAGDNGAVAQLNAAAGPSDESRSPAAPSTSTAAPSTPAAAPTAASSSEWYWQWNCKDLPTSPVVSPTGSTTGSVPASWTWIWNCGDNSDQYQGDTVDQYQQINTNVSIRISSPGSDGPVTQTNLAISTGISVPISLPQLPRAPTTVALPAISVPMPSIGISLPSIGFSLPSIVVGHSAGASQGTPSVIPLVDIDWEENVAGVSFEIDTLVAGEIVSGVPVPATPVGPVPGEASPAAPPETLRGGPGHRATSVAPHRDAPFATPVPAVAAAAFAAVAAASSPASQEAAPRSRPRPSPRWTPSEGPSPRAPATAPSGASAASAAGGGGSSGGLPVFLALPFVAVLLDLARRVALERATWPSGHRRRVPDTPG